jgi:DNA-directed RNA polymerase subunit omega
MIHPSYTELMNVINKDVEPGEQPAIQSRYSLVIATSKRARQIIDGSQPYVNGKGKKPLSVAIEELYKGKVKIVGDVADNE